MSLRNPDVAARIRAHHEAMAAELDSRVFALMQAVRRGEPYRAALSAMVAYVENDILPHAAAEEETLYAAAARRQGGRPLVEALTAEHDTIGQALEHLRQAGDAVHTVAAGAALAALFRSHAALENDVLLPLLLDDPAADLASLLEGMHQRLLGAADADAAAACTTAAIQANGTAAGGPETSATAQGAGEDGGDPELDVRTLPPFQRHG